MKNLGLPEQNHDAWRPVAARAADSVASASARAGRRAGDSARLGLPSTEGASLFVPSAEGAKNTLSLLSSFMVFSSIRFRLPS